MLEAMRPIDRSKVGIANPRGVFDPIAAFDIYLRGGLEALSPEASAVLDYQKFNAAMGTTSGRDGGFTVPDGFYRQLISAEKSYGGMLQAANIIDTDSGNPLAIPTDDDTGNIGRDLAREYTSCRSADRLRHCGARRSTHIRAAWFAFHRS